MRLLDTKTGQFVQRDPEKVKVNERTVYAILSHTWDAKEQTYEELIDIQRRYEVGKVHQNPPNVTKDPSDSVPSRPHSLAALGRLTQTQVEALIQMFAQKHDLPSSPQSRPSIPEGVASSGAQDSGGPSFALSPSEQEQPLSNCPSPHVAQSTYSKPRFTRGMARLKRWIQHRSTRNVPHSPSSSPSAATQPRATIGLHRSQEHDRSGESHVPPPASQIEPPLVNSGPLKTALGHLTWSEVEVSFRKFIETCDLTSLLPAPIPSDTSSPAQGGQPSLSPLPNDPPVSLPTTPGRLTPSEVEALLSTLAERYGLARPAAVPATRAPSAPTPDSPTQLPQSGTALDDPHLSPKIREACRVARENGYCYIWIDSCCINKSSSSELSEAINSMFKWYSLAAVCYAYLSDVPPGENHHADRSAFRKSRWFSRGWTLQELIAPGRVEFLSKDWAPIASKHTLVNLVESVTKIQYKALLNTEPLDAFSVAQRLSWAAKRETTREEDRAYSMLGIFDINMPTPYGEGNRAFRRLQEQIMQRIPDQSLFAWGDLYLSSQLPRNVSIHDFRERYYSESPHLFAVSPNKFLACEDIGTPNQGTTPPDSRSVLRQDVKIQYTSTPYGVCTQLQMIPLDLDLVRDAIPREDLVFNFPDSPKGSQWYLAILGCEHKDYPRQPLGRVCYTLPSKTDVDVQHVYTRFIHVQSRQTGGTQWRMALPDLLLLPPAIIERCRPTMEVKTVYIPHPDRSNLVWSLRRQPFHAGIKFMLLRETHDTLLSKGYSVDLRNPDTPNPDIHWLTISNLKDENTKAIIELHHTLKLRGRQLIVDAQVEIHSESGLDTAALHPDQANLPWKWMDNYTPQWHAKLGHKSARLNLAGDLRTLTLDLEFAGGGYYILRVDILNDAQPASESSAAEPVGDKAREGERSEESLLPGTLGDTEDAGREGPENSKASGHASPREAAPRMEAQLDVTATRDDIDILGS